MRRDAKRATDVGALYEAAVDPDSWPDVLQDLARSFDAAGCCIVLEHGVETLIAPAFSPELAGPLHDYMQNGWHARDLRGARAWPQLKAGEPVALEQDICSDEERRMSAYHNEWLRPWDLPWWASVGFRCADRWFGLSVLRNSAQGPFSRADARQLATLGPHLARAVMLAQQLSLRQARTSLDLLELNSRPAFLVDHAGGIAACNRGAEALIGRDFTLRGRALRAVDPASNKALQRLIRAVLAPPFPSAAPEEEPVVIRRDGRSALVVHALPTARLLSDVFVGTRALLIAIDLDERPAPAVGKVRELFGLTPTEAQLAIRLAQEESLTEAAGALGITAGTARLHLKSIFLKTDTHRQAELIALMQRIGTLAL